MQNYNNNAYELLVSDLINDAFYLDERSRRGTIATIRQYTEVIIRRILDLPHGDSVTIGNKKIISKIKQKSNNNKFLLSSLETIRDIGNKCTHTKEINEITSTDVKTVIESLFNLLSYLLIDYFERHEFGCNSEIVTSFSILPPIIRYITLNYLHCQYPTNILIIDKLALAILKAFNKVEAEKWINEKKDFLETLPTVTEEAKQGVIDKYGIEFAELLVSTAPPNMYVLCVERIEKVNSIIEQKGRLYFDFESAVEIYRKEGKVAGDTIDIVEFNSIMEFLYLGRRARNNELLKAKDSYLIIDNL